MRIIYLESRVGNFVKSSFWICLFILGSVRAETKEYVGLLHSSVSSTEEAYVLDDSISVPTLFRYTKVRKWHVELEWEAADNAVSFEVYQNDIFKDSISGTTYVAVNLLENTNYTFKVRAKSSTGDFSDFAPTIHVRTGLYPKEEISTMRSYSFSQPPSGNSWFINEFGVSERRITDRTVNGDIPNNIGDYAKAARYQVKADGTYNWISTLGVGANKRQRYNYNTLDKLPIETRSRFITSEKNNDDVTWRGIGNSLVRRVDDTATTVWTGTGYRNDTSSTLSTAESAFSFDARYIALEMYKTGDSNTWCVVLDLLPVLNNTGSPIVVSEVSVGDIVAGGSVAMSASGKFVVWHIADGTNEGTHFYVRNNDATQSDTGLGDFSVLRTGHGDYNQTIQGNDCWVGRDAGKTYMYVFEGPKGGHKINMYPNSGFDTEIHHSSGHAYDNIGWHYLDGQHPWGYNSTSPRARNYRMNYAICLDEYVEDRNEDCLVRIFSRGMWQGSLNSTDGKYKSHYAVGSPDGLILTYNQNLPSTVNGHAFGELYVAQQLLEHGDEIPFSGDTTAPIASNITVSDITNDSFKASWNLDEGSKGRIEYGTSSGNYTEETISEENFLTSHLQSVGNNNAPPLQAGTTYYWRIRTEDVSANVGYSDEQVTTTAGIAPQTDTLTPVHDAYLQGSTRYNTSLLRVEAGNRVSYLKYDLSGISGTITGAELHFRIGSDAGLGTMQVYMGTATSWTETTLSTSNRPSEDGLLGTTTAIATMNTDVVLPLLVGGLSGGGDLSLIVKHVGSDDFSMVSKEDASFPGPTLVVTYQGSSNIQVTGVTVSPASLTMDIGDADTVAATVVPSNATNQNVTWSSNDTAVATVDSNGGLTAVASGTATVTATTVDGSFTDMIGVTVNSNAPVVTVVTVSDIMENSFKASWSLNEGSKGRIEYGTTSGNYTEETTSEENFLTNHIQIVGNNNAPPLQAGTTYYWRIRTENSQGSIGYSDEQLTTTASAPQTDTLNPIHDAYLQGSTRYNTSLLRVEAGNRVSYMKYDLSGISGTITGAELHFRIGSDAGLGTMQVYKGTATSWTETTLSTSNRPSEDGLLGTTTTIATMNTDVVLPLSIGGLSGGGDLSLIVKHVGSNDFSMVSKEDASFPGPMLVLTYIPTSGTSLKATVDFADNLSGDFPVVLYPNPTTNKVTVQGVSGLKEITIFDLTGRVLLNDTTSEAAPSYDLREYPSGIYYIAVQVQETKRTFKIIKQ